MKMSLKPPVHHQPTTCPPSVHHLSPISPPPVPHQSTTSPPPVLHLSTISPPPVLHQSTICPPPVHHLSTTSPPSVHHQSTICPPPVHHQSTTNPPPVHHQSGSCTGLAPGSIPHSVFTILMCSDLLSLFRMMMEAEPVLGTLGTQGIHLEEKNKSGTGERVKQ
ncbi:uncharacterized, partial [Tachysurus ichikawai]